MGPGVWLSIDPRGTQGNKIPHSVWHYISEQTNYNSSNGVIAHLYVKIYLIRNSDCLNNK